MKQETPKEQVRICGAVLKTFESSISMPVNSVGTEVSLNLAVS